MSYDLRIAVKDFMEQDREMIEIDSKMYYEHKKETFG